MGNHKITVAEYIADFVAESLRVNTIFTVTGGGAMFLNDSFGNSPKLKAVYNHHEQASAMAAVGFAKARNSYGVACVTTGCGCTNALTGLLDAWQDSAMLFVVSGQVKVSNTSHLASTPLRQFGVQEADILPIVQPLTKFCAMVTDPKKIRMILEEAAFWSANGRPGPVWIDVPQDIQGALVDPSDLEGFTPAVEGDRHDYDMQLKSIYKKLQTSERPVILAGNGVRLSHTSDQFKAFAERLNVPVVFSYLSLDLLPSDHELAIGRLGAKGDRPGNFAVQNADLVLVLGCRLSVALTGFEYDLFARDAEVIVVDIDEAEHEKGTVDIDLFLNMDLRKFFELEELQVEHPESWNIACKRWKGMWPVYQEDYSGGSLINMYECIEQLNRKLPSNAHVISDAGSAYYVTSQAIKVAEGNKYHTSGAQADMGFTLPAAIGVAEALQDSPVVGITGDGSFQMNIQELQVLRHNQQNVKIIILNNDGYLSIRTTQKKFFDGRFAGTGKDYGLSNPNFADVVNAYGLRHIKVTRPSELSSSLDKLFADDEPCILEVICPEWQEVIPNVSALKRDDGSMVSKPLEDMYPFLERETFMREMVVKPIVE